MSIPKFYFGENDFPEIVATSYCTLNIGLAFFVALSVLVLKEVFYLEY